MNVGELLILLGVSVDKGSFSQASTALASLKASAMAVTAVRFAEHLVEGAAEAGMKLVQLSQGMGLTVEQVQQWQYVAEQSGSDVKKFAVGMGQLEGNLRKFAAGRGGKELAATMREIGVSTQDAKTALASPDGLDHVLLKTSDRLKAMGNNAERGALTTSLFGKRAGREMAGDLARGSDAILEMRKHFQELGGQMSTAQANQLKDLNSTIKDLKFSFRGLAYQAIAALAPMLKGLVLLMQSLTVAMRYVVDVAQKMAHHWGIVLLAVVSLAAAFVMLKAASIAAAIESAAAWVLSMIPIVLLAALIAAVILIVNDLWVEFNGGKGVLRDLWAAAVEWAKQNDGAIASVVLAIDKLVDKAKAATHEMMKLGRVIGGIGHIKELREVESEQKSNSSRRDDISKEMAKMAKMRDSMDASGTDSVLGISRQQVVDRIAKLDAETKGLAARGKELASRRHELNRLYGDPENQEFDTRSEARKGFGKGVDRATGWAAAGINAPVTIHVDGAKDPKAVADEVGKWFQEHITNTAVALAATTPGGKVR